jgi:hypothetical protein
VNQDFEEKKLHQDFEEKKLHQDSEVIVTSPIVP